MKKSNFSEEQIAYALRQIESGSPPADVSVGWAYPQLETSLTSSESSRGGESGGARQSRSRRSLRLFSSQKLAAGAS